MSLTTEQIELMVQESESLVLNPLPWKNLSQVQHDVFLWLMPNPSFTETQRHYLSLWVLPVTQQQLNDINALMPSHHVVEPRKSLQDHLYINADLLSDAINEGRLSSILSIIDSLPLTYSFMIQWDEAPVDLTSIPFINGKPIIQNGNLISL